MRSSSRRAVTETKVVEQVKDDQEEVQNGKKSEEKPKTPKAKTPKAKKEKAKKPEPVESEIKSEDDIKEEEKAGENGDVKKESSKEKTKKPLKKCLPPWVQPSSASNKSLPAYSRPANNLIKEAIEEYGDAKGVATARSIGNYIEDTVGAWNKKKLRSALDKAVAKGSLDLVRGSGLSGSYRLAKAKKGKKGAKEESEKSLEPLENHFANILTWVTNPKESSVQLIRKYIGIHFPKLDATGNAFRKAIERGESYGQIKRITGVGNSGTFCLVDGAKKTNTNFEDAIEDAMIAMNEPKECSIILMRDYLDEYYPEYKTNMRPKVLKNALDRAEERGWIVRISGSGFSGSYRLVHPYYPSPPQLWGKWYEEEEEEDSEEEEEEEEIEEPKAKKAKKGKAKPTYVEDDSEDEVEEEYSPKKKPRGAPKKRSNPPPKTKKPVKTPAPKKSPVKAKKSPAKVASPKKKAGQKRKR